MSVQFSIGRIAAAILLCLSVPAVAQEFRAGPLTIDRAWSRATPPAAKVGAGYLVVTNGGQTPDRLTAASSPAAGRVEVHEMQMDGGVMRMRELAQGLAVPPGASVELKPGGYHLMLMELRAPLAAGATVPVTLVFERAGRVDIQLRVEPVTARGPQPQAPASGHKH
jgi:periplasmic copper chaperone A